MKATTILGSALLAVVATVHGSVLPRDDLTEPASLTDLLESAKSQVVDGLNENEEKLRKRGATPSCTLSKLVYRRE
jgi:tyrosinase